MLVLDQKSKSRMLNIKIYNTNVRIAIGNEAKNKALFPAHRPGEIIFASYPAANKKIFFISPCNI